MLTELTGQPIRSHLIALSPKEARWLLGLLTEQIQLGRDLQLGEWQSERLRGRLIEGMAERIKIKLIDTKGSKVAR